MEAPTGLHQKLAALADLGFQRVDASSIPDHATPVSGNRHRISSATPSMGTLVSITGIHGSRDLIEEAIGRTNQEMDRLVGLLNRYDPDSALWALNDRGVLTGPPPELSTVLNEAIVQHRRSRGAFDPTVQPLVDLLRDRRAAGTLAKKRVDPPRAEEIRELLPLMDAGAVDIGPRGIRLERKGMGLTLDGIAKGFVVDRMAEVLSSMGIEDFLINAGGDIRGSGVREDGQPWRVAVQDPDGGARFPDVFPLAGAVATSGSYEIYFDPEPAHHHIIDPKIGLSPTDAKSVTVVAPTAMEADALATSAFLMEPEQGPVFIDSIPGCACLIVDRQGRQFRSTQWRSHPGSPTDKAETL